MCYILDICIHTHTVRYLYILEHILGDMEKASPRSEGKPLAFSACCKVHAGH